MGYVKDIMDRVIRIQELILSGVNQQDLDEGEGNTAEVQIVGVDGESMRLRFDGDRVRYADENETPLHVIRMSTDCFIDLIEGTADLDYLHNNGYVTFYGRDWLYHATKIKRGFVGIRGILKRIFGAKIKSTFGG